MPQTGGDSFYLLSAAVKNSRGHVAAPLEGFGPSWRGLRLVLFRMARAAGLHPRDASCLRQPAKCKMTRASSFLFLGTSRSRGMAGVGGSCGDTGTGLNCHQRGVLVSTPGNAGGEAVCQGCRMRPPCKGRSWGLGCRMHPPCEGGSQGAGIQDASFLQWQELGVKKPFGRGSSGDVETQGVPLCIPANLHVPPGSCFQVAKRLFPCL